MSYTPESELNSRWLLRITAGYKGEHQLTVDYHLIVDSDNVLAVQVALLSQDPSISSIQCDRYYGGQPSSLRNAPVLAGQS